MLCFRSKEIIRRGVEKLDKRDLEIGMAISALPKIIDWIEKLVEANSSKAVSASSLGFSRINKLFSSDFLDKVQVVKVDGNVPYPPLEGLGLNQSQIREREEHRKKHPARGVTFKDMVFIVKRHIRAEDLLFHELVHVVQWEKLGVKRFLLAYGEGLINLGYRGMPLERIAYDLQGKFDKNETLPPDLIEYIKSDAVKTWNTLESMIQKLKNSGKFSFLQDLKPL